MIITNKDEVPPFGFKVSGNVYHFEDSVNPFNSESGTNPQGLSGYGSLAENGNDSLVLKESSKFCYEGTVIKEVDSYEGNIVFLSRSEKIRIGSGGVDSEGNYEATYPAPLTGYNEAMREDSTIDPNKKVGEYLGLTLDQIDQDIFWLLDQPANSPETPYEIEITDFSASDVRDSHTVGTIGYTLNRRKAVYVDISATHLPDSEFDHVTSLDNSFQDCTSLVKAPSIPSCVTSALHTFQGCRNLKEAPAIPNTISNISYMFQTCTSLVNAPIIPESVTNMSWAFANCFSLVNAPILPSNLQNCKEAFMDCHSLDYKPVLPSNVTESTDCYKNVSTNYWKGTKSQAEICPYDCWFEFINNDKITVDFTCYNVGISTLSTWLSSQDNNDKEAPYVVYLRNLTTSNYSNIKTALQANSSKYVDLHYTELPSGITSLSQCFYNCSSLIIPPQLPSTVRNISQIFRYCTNLKEAPVIPNGVLEMSYAFQSCDRQVLLI